MGLTTTGWDTTTNQDVFKTLVKEWWNLSDRPPLKEWPNVVNELTSDEEYERRGRYAGLGYPGELTEGQQIAPQTPRFGQVKDWHQVAYGTGIRISHRMKKFEKISLFETLVRDLKRVQIEGKDIEIAKMFNSASATTYAAGFDTLALASNSHTCLDVSATTYDNYLDANISISSMESALNYFDYMYDDQAQIITMKPDTLIINYTLQWDALEFIKSSGKPWEFSNTESPYQGILTPFVYHRLTSTTAWFVAAKKDPRYDLFVITSMEPDSNVYSVDSSRDTIVDTIQYFKYGFGDPRALYVGDL